jgi:hypothetical protein
LTDQADVNEQTGPKFLGALSVFDEARRSRSNKRLRPAPCSRHIVYFVNTQKLGRGNLPNEPGDPSHYRWKTIATHKAVRSWINPSRCPPVMCWRLKWNDLPPRGLFRF